MKNFIYVLLVGMLFSAGCAIVSEIPTPETVMRQPLGTDAVKIGMTKHEVRSIWGEPDSIETQEVKGLDGTREVWSYKAKYGIVPVDVGYLSKNRTLYFDGDNLTKISE